MKMGSIMMELDSIQLGLIMMELDSIQLALYSDNTYSFPCITLQEEPLHDMKELLLNAILLKGGTMSLNFE